MSAARAPVAVRRLSPAQRGEIARHLARLSPEDRRLRFGRSMSGEALERHVARIDFARDRVFGIHAPGLELAGAAHLALDPDGQLAELGLSVDPALRGRGYGAALLARGVLHAANLGYRALFMHCLAENRVMLHLAHKAGLKVVVHSGEADARIALERGAGGGLREALEDQFALVDYLLRQQGDWIARGALQSRREAADEHRRAARAAEAHQGEVPDLA